MYMPVAVMLGFLSWADIKKREVPDFAVLALFLYSFFVIENFKMSLIVGSFVFAVNLMLAVVTDGGIGGGDIKLMSVIAFMMGEDFFLLVLPLGFFMVLTLIYCLMTGKDIRYSVPFVPYMFVSFLITWGCNTWITLNTLF
jgi:leader peptidase (prepilin peptidase)/N-methyltransferase